MEKQTHNASTNNLLSDINTVMRIMDITIAKYLTNRSKAAFLLWPKIAFLHAGLIMLVYISLDSHVINAVTMAVIITFNSICINVLFYLHVKFGYDSKKAKNNGLLNYKSRIKN
jgi:hypothetical protein